jgi:hypothetical protein
VKNAAGNLASMKNQTVFHLIVHIVDIMETGKHGDYKER